MNYKLLANLLVLAFAGCLSTGCETFRAPDKQMDQLNSMAAKVANSLQDGSLAQFQGSGQAINPGVTVEASIVYRAVARYEGLAGQFSVAGQGQLVHRPDVQAEIWKIANDTTRTEQERFNAIINLLKGNTNVQAVQESN